MPRSSTIRSGGIAKALFYDLIQVCLYHREKLSRNPTPEEWKELYEMSKKQAVLGVVFSSLERLSLCGQKPPLDVLYNWIAYADYIKRRNCLLNQRCCELLNLFEEFGYESCILKGQGNAFMYPEPLLRSSGDIDIWVKGDKDGIISLCNLKTDNCVLSEHHISFPIWSDVDVEVHFVPSFTRVPRFENNTEEFFRTFEREEVDLKGLMPDGTKMYIPSSKVNLVFQMSHMMRHFFYGGIGLRQLMDYYYLLTTVEEVNESVDYNTFEYLGMAKFAGAVMWVLKELFGLEDRYIIMPEDKERGTLLLDEIMQGGNFGQFDNRISGRIRHKSITFSNIIRNARMVWLFPEEAVFGPLMKVSRRWLR